MNWEKLGRVYVANGEQPWKQTHAYCPTPVRIGDRIRVYVAFLDDEKIGRTGYVDVDPSDPTKILEVSDEPVLGVGDRGTFDEHGVTPTSALRVGGDVYLYYFGWQRGVDVRYFLFTGLAVSEDGKSFTRRSEVPILDRVDGERYVRSAPNVVKTDRGHEMWYVSGDRWIEVEDKEVPTYGIRHLESDDPTFSDRQKGTRCIDPMGGDEYGFGRPFVVREGGQYRMWYSIRTRSKGYRIGYAESDDGVEWERMDDRTGPDVSSRGWDSEMTSFPAIFDSEGERYMFYNGNNYGETGFGVARLESDE